MFFHERTELWSGGSLVIARRCIPRDMVIICCEKPTAFDSSEDEILDVLCN